MQQVQQFVVYSLILQCRNLGFEMCTGVMGIFAYFYLPQHVILNVVLCKYTNLGEIICQLENLEVFLTLSKGYWFVKAWFVCKKKKPSPFGTDGLFGALWKRRRLSSSCGMAVCWHCTEKHNPGSS